ncbi:Calcipressin-domain-containing protein [Violaceomyces palustris]|uniref:Calcipressin-domain-containing protein n=1 Tax=Violaceomyces palustris TaxID=1673888 RepID=A0ACD0NP82_9BASI|nr:Calcipressin-domain-containing protein [Violaceomyces palustris]
MEWPSGGEGGEEAEEGETGEGRPIQEEEPTNTLILSNLPAEFFVPSVCSALLSLLNAYGPMVRWTPLASAGRAVVIFERSQDAEMAKRSLDRLLLPFQEVGIGEEDTEADLTPRRAGQEEVYDESSGGGGTPFLKVVYGRFTSPTETQPSSLSVPSTDKNFLISPPGSPPVGWEPIREDPPNRDTLAEDLMRALGELRDTQSHIRSHKPRFWGCGGEEGGRGETTTRNGGGPPHPPPEVILLAVSETEEDGILPGVTVQSMDAEEEGDEGSKDGRGRTPPRFSISSVKATVESMRGPTTSTGASSGSLGGQRDEGEDGEIGGGLGWGQGGKRITPTSRPPLA